MNTITNILNNLVGFSTIADKPEEIERGFNYISSLFDSRKFKVQNFERNGKRSQLISFQGKNALQPQILLNGHFDVVPAEDKNQYKVKIEGKKAFGRGTADMKGMLAVLIDVMKQLGTEKNPPSVALLITGDEEVGGESGTGFLVHEVGLRPEFVLCADGGGEQKLKLVTKEKGGVWIELIAKGKAAHAAYPWLGENAIEKVFKVFLEIKKMVGVLEPKAWKSTVSIALLETSNRTPNKVPDNARAVLDIRFTEELAKNPSELIGKIKDIAKDVEVRGLSNVSLLFVDEQNSFIQRFKSVLEEVSGLEVPFAFEHGATDARFFGEVGIPSVIFGPVSGNMHADKEWVDLASLKIYREALLRFLKRT